MCHAACLKFGEQALPPEELRGRDVLEVGSRDYNGSMRQYAQRAQPKSYLGIDMQPGPGVDEVCDGNDIIRRFGENRFDVVICTEVMEHVQNWRLVCLNLKRVLKPGGLLLLTTRSRGFHYHAYPYDFWRYELDDARKIFGDLELLLLESDSAAPGIFLKARKPLNFVERPVPELALYSMLKQRRCPGVTSFDIFCFRVKFEIRGFLSRILPRGLKDGLKRVFGAA